MEYDKMRGQRDVGGAERINDTAFERNQTVDERILSDADRLEAFRNSFYQSSLPDLPRIPGWHVCWLTTNNPRDTIHNRMIMGYEPVKPEDVPGWEYLSLKTGEWTGFIGVNEMLAMKLPERLYQQFMMHSHYNEPLSKERNMNESAQRIADQYKSRLVDVDDGTAELSRRVGVQAPVFT